MIKLLEYVYIELMSLYIPSSNIPTGHQHIVHWADVVVDSGGRAIAKIFGNNGPTLVTLTKSRFPTGGPTLGNRLRPVDRSALQLTTGWPSIWDIFSPVAKLPHL